MRVLIVSFFYEPEIGAAPCRIANLAKGMYSKGINVDVLTSLPNYPKGRIFEGYRGRLSMHEVCEGINIHRYWTYATVSKNVVLRVFAMFSFAFTLWSYFFYFKKIRSYDRVIIQSPPIVVAASALLLFGKVFRKHTVLNVSDLWPSSAVELGYMKEGSLSFRFTSMIERFLYKNATDVMGQSVEILNRVKELQPSKKCFLYRNLFRPASDSCGINTDSLHNRKPLKIVYAGLLGVAQNIYSLICNVDFMALGVEMHIYGGGNQTEDICRYIENGDKNIFYHGVVSKKQIDCEMPGYDLSIVTLANNITGAVPSKIFDLLPSGVPILFCGEGEGADIVNKYGFGLLSAHDDYNSISENINRFANMTESQYYVYSNNCIKASKTVFSFDSQIEKYIDFLRQ